MKKHRKLKSQRKSHRNNPSVQSPPIDILKFLTDMLVGLLQDCYNKFPFYSCADYAKDCETIKRRVQSEGIGFTSLTLPNLSQGLFDLLESRPASFPGFKLQPGTQHPVFMRALFNEVLRDEEKAGPVVKAIYQVSVLFKKLEGPLKRHKLRKQYADFVKVDVELGNIDWFSESLFPILETARRLFREFSEYTNLDDFLPRPGPGATYSKTEKRKRYEPHVLFEQIDNVLPYQEYFYPTPWHACLEARNYLSLKKLKRPKARYKIVPKKYGTGRGICIEENEMQWFQQGLAKVLCRGIERHPLLSRRIKINDQGLNAQQALFASASRDRATIDESEASDRVAREGVAWMSQDTELYEPLMALSTKVISPPRECAEFGDLHTNKYAPMGAGLCFPVMCLYHMFLIQAIILHSDQYDTVGLSRQVYVYGDDIVLPSSCVQAVYDYLPLFGIKINTTKSFVKSYFRESCGTHAYNGMIITPVFIKKLPSPNHVNALSSLLAAESQLFYGEWFETANKLRSVIAGIYRLKRLYCPIGSALVGFQRCAKLLQFLAMVHLKAKQRENSDLQCKEYRIKVFHAPTKIEIIDNEIAGYLRTFVQPSMPWTNREVGDLLDVLLIRQRWLPESHLLERRYPEWFKQFLERDQNELSLVHAKDCIPPVEVFEDVS